MSSVLEILKNPKPGEHFTASRTVVVSPESRDAVQGVERLELGEVIELYRSVGRRNVEYFGWLHDIYSWIALPSVSFDWKSVLSEDKTKLAIFDIMVDDLADNYATRNYSLLEQFTNIPWQSVSPSNADNYLEVGSKIWRDAISSISHYPRFGEFERIFYFDLRQVFSSMMYSYLANTAGIGNPLETSFYSSYGCMIEAALDLDLMCSPAFDLSELQQMRTIAGLAQRIAHVANMLTTYPSEILERDISCPIISLAIRNGLIRRDELGDKAVLPKIAKLEWIFKNKAYTYIRKIAEYEKEIRSVNIRGFSGYLTELFEKFDGGKPLR